MQYLCGIKAVLNFKYVDAKDGETEGCLSASINGEAGGAAEAKERPFNNGRYNQCSRHFPDVFNGFSWQMEI